MNPNQPTGTNNAPRPIDPNYVQKSGSSFKKIIFIVVAFFVIFLLGIGGYFLYAQIQSSNKDKVVTLRYWGVWDDPAIMQPIIQDFERQHPNIKVQYEMQDIKGLGQYVDRLVTRINNGNEPPDIIRFHSSWMLQLRKHLLPFPQDFIESTKLDTDFYKTVEKDLKIDGAYYGIPLGVDTLSLFVNTKMLEDKNLPIPTDWNDIYTKYTPQLVVKDQSGKIITPSIALGTFDNISHAPDIIAFLLLQNRADLYDLGGETKENAYDAIRFYTSFAGRENAVWDQTLDNSTLAFAKGNLAFYFGYSWDIFTIKSLNPSLDFKVVTVPTLAGRKNTVASYWAEGVSVKTKYPKEAFEFLSYISKPEVLQKLYQTQSKVRLFGTLYPRKSMADLLKDNEMIYPFIQQADDAQSTFFSSDTYDGDSGMISQMNVYLGNAIRSINNNTSVTTAVDTLAQGVNQVLSRY